MAFLGDRHVAEQRKLVGHGGDEIGALSGLQNEATRAVQVDAIPAKGSGMAVRDRAFKAVIVVLAIGAGGFRRFSPPKPGQFARKAGEIRHLAAARWFPAADERGNGRLTYSP